jgi:hypothetical protein
MSAGARRAALALHAMSAADRAWALDALDERERTAIEPLLGELEALGLESDPGLFETALDDAARSASPARVDTPSGRPPALADADAADIAFALTDEPARAIALVLRSIGPDRTRSVLAQLDSELRSQVESEAMTRQGSYASVVGPLVEQSLQDALQARLDANWYALRAASGTHASTRSGSAGTHGTRADLGGRVALQGPLGASLRSAVTGLVRRLALSRSVTSTSGRR